MQRKRHLFFTFLILAFTCYTAFVFMDSVTPYVPISEAKTSTKIVQVKGILDRSERTPCMKEDKFIFQLKDEDGEKLTVSYQGQKPEQFDSAFHIVAIGKYEGGVFNAKKLLIKCPSKYEKERP